VHYGACDFLQIQGARRELSELSDRRATRKLRESARPSENTREAARFKSQKHKNHNVQSVGRATLETRGLVIGPFDLQIAAIARLHDLTLVSGNLEEFSRIPGLKIENWSS